MGVTIYPVISVNTTLTRRRKNMEDRQNGSRLGAHRKPRVSAESWMLLVGLIAALFIFCELATAQEYKPYTIDTGVIVDGAEICFSPDLHVTSVQLLITWQRLVNELDAYEKGGARMNEEDAIAGELLYENHLCATMGAYYSIVITQAMEGYVLAHFDEQYGFGEGPFIVAKKDVLPDHGI
jgi:hypothetical protein